MKAKAADRVAQQQAASYAAAHALPVEIGLHQALLEEVHRAAGYVAWYEAQLHRVIGGSPDTLVRGIRLTRRVEGPDGVATTTTEAGPQVLLWQSELRIERRMLVEAVRVALNAGVEERRVQAEEQRAEEFGRLIAGLAEDMGYVAGDRDEFFAKSQARFRLVRGGAA